MPPKVINLSFEGSGAEQIKSFFEKSGATGYVSKIDNSWNAVILDAGRIITEIGYQRFVSGPIKIETMGHIKTGSFRELVFVELKSSKESTDVIHLDGITPNGLLKGWGTSASGKACEVRVWVDESELSKIPVDQFRLDLFEAGIGNGCNAFASRLSDAVLDGHEHRIRVELIEIGSSERKPIATAKGSFKLPFNFNLPRPWVGGGEDHAYEWSEENEAEYLSLRMDILNGGGERAQKKAASFIDKYPRAIFLDFGIKDSCNIRGDAFLGFKRKLRDRWWEHFGRTCCIRGAACCKKVDLPYNQPSLIEKGSAKPIEFSDPWADGGTLASCPIPIRHFASKKLTNDFAHSAGVRVAKTIGYINNIKDFDKFPFPDRYVLKPDFASGVELYLMSGSLNLFDGFKISKDEIRKRVGSFLKKGGDKKFIVEEFIRQEGVEGNLPVIPLDYKFHCFGGKARIVHVDDKNSISRDPLHRKQSWLARDWSHTPAPFRSTGEHPNEPIKKPKCFGEMLRISDEISRRLNGYVRVDLYASPEGPVLGEVTSYSHSGLGFSEYGDLILGQAWEIFEGQ